MNTYYLVRHGQDEDNANGILNGHRDTPLTKIGRQQAQELSNKINESDIKCDLVLCSPLKRAYETAHIISKNLNFSQPIIDPLLIERDFGVMTGKTHSDILPLCSPDVIQSPKFISFLNPPGAESFPELLKRASNLLKMLDKKYDNKNILLVSHGDFGKMIYAYYYQLDWQELLKSYHFGNSDMIKLSKEIDSKGALIFNIKQYNV